MIDKGITYEDQRLTKKQKKKIKPAKQGGGPNYLGKQKTVTVPTKWLSDPDHVVAELAYITPREKKILIDLDLYGSLNGKPNRGPAGIQSLQGDMGGFGGTGGPSGGGGGGNGGGNGGGGGRQDTESQYGGDYSYDSSQNVSDRGQEYGGNNTPEDTREQYSVTRTTTPIDEEVEVAPISEPERDTGLERARLANIALAEDLKNTKYEDVQTKIPSFIPYSGLINTGLNILGGFGFEKNKDFFAENVAGKYGYGYGYEDFEQYMEDRLSGKVGAYGNENMGQNAINERAGGDDRSDTSGIIEALIQPVEKPEETISPIKGFDYVPYSNQVVVAPGREGLESLMGRGRRKELPQPFRGETFSEVPEQYKAGFDAYTQENPIGAGGQAMTSVMLPDGNRVMFTNTASAGAFRNYLESIGVLTPTETSDEDSFSQIVI